MKVVQWALGITAAVSLIIVLLVSSVEIAAYGDYGFYQKEYEKYGVLEDVNMEMADVMDVTREMMAYLRGNRDDLVVETVVGGQQQEFFNQREKDHMADVRNLFIGGIWLRRILVVLCIICVTILVLIKANLKRLLPLAYMIGTGLFLLITGGLALLFASDFTKYFTIFHEIFFTNDLWLLDPDTDLMINILPEGFFVDMVMRIGVIFIISLVVTLIISIVCLRFCNRKKSE